MSGLENEPANPELELFGEEYREALEGFLEGAEDNEFFKDPVSPDPFSLGVSDDTLEDMDIDHLGAVRNVLHRVLQIDPMDPDTLIREYVAEAPETAESPGEIKVAVLKTKFKGMGLHEMRFKDRMVRWTVGNIDQNM